MPAAGTEQTAQSRTPRALPIPQVSAPWRSERRQLEWSAQYVKPFHKVHNNDYRDGEAIAEVVQHWTPYAHARLGVSPRSLPTQFDLLLAAVLLSLIEHELGAVLRHTLTGAPPVLFAHVRRRVPILHALLEVFGTAFQYFVWRPYAGNL
jgi:hypothetical protein